MLDPAGFCEALTRSAKKAGARVVENCQVTGIDTIDTLLGGRKVSTVHTSRGSIKTNKVINATGAWARNISAFVGLTVPVIPFKIAYVVTEKIEGIQKMPSVRDFEANTYFKTQGDSLLIGGYERNPHFAEPVSSCSCNFIVDDLPYTKICTDYKFPNYR